MILKEYWNTEKVDRRKNKNYICYFYVILIHKGRKRYIKVGITSQTPHQRFKKYQTQNYIVDKIIYICECTDCEEVRFERHCQKEWGKIKGLRHIPFDRFSYFQIPNNLIEIINSMVAPYRK